MLDLNSLVCSLANCKKGGSSKDYARIIDMLVGQINGMLVTETLLRNDVRSINIDFLNMVDFVNLASEIGLVSSKEDLYAVESYFYRRGLPSYYNDSVWDTPVIEGIVIRLLTDILSNILTANIMSASDEYNKSIIAVYADYIKDVNNFEPLTDVYICNEIVDVLFREFGNIKDSSGMLEKKLVKLSSLRGSDKYAELCADLCIYVKGLL